jgi:hypothetical protein
MVLVTFKAEDELKEMLNNIAKRKGLSLSSYIKSVLRAALNEELSSVTENGFTVAEEIEILASSYDEEVIGPFENINDLFKALDQK